MFRAGVPGFIVQRRNASVARCPRRRGAPPRPPEAALRWGPYGLFVYFLCYVGRVEGKRLYKYGYSQSFHRSREQMNEEFGRCDVVGWWVSDTQMPHNGGQLAPGPHLQARMKARQLLCQQRATSVVEWFSRRSDVQRATRPYLVIGGKHKQRVMSPIGGFDTPQMLALMSQCVRISQARVPLRRQYGGRRPNFPLRDHDRSQQVQGYFIQKRRHEVLGGKDVYGDVSM